MPGFPRRPQSLEIAARFPHSRSCDEQWKSGKPKPAFPLSHCGCCTQSADLRTKTRRPEARSSVPPFRLILQLENASAGAGRRWRATAVRRDGHREGISVHCRHIRTNSAERRHHTASRACTGEAARLFVLFHGVGAGIVIGVIALLFLFRTPQNREAMIIAPFTAVPGLQFWPAFSPDGNQVAFGWTGDTGNCSHIYCPKGRRRLASEAHGFRGLRFQSVVVA